MMDKSFFRAVGRRKSAIARVQIRAGAGEIVVNGKTLVDFFPWLSLQKAATEPLRTAGVEGKYTVMAKVLGGGITGQADAISLGLARAIQDAEPELRTQLKRAGLLTRDPRVKERKKYGLKRARKAPQYTKR